MTRPLNEIAREIKAIWSTQGKGVNYAAEPYLNAMLELNSIDDRYYAEDARTQVRYFISNAASFQGEDAKRLKAELRSMLDK
jgi:hypothetical protein